jgi:carboxylesterase type B
MGSYQSPERVSTYAQSLKADVVGELDSSGLALFRGIPYATLNKRWTQSTPLHQLQSPFNAVEFGPRCPQGNGMVLVSGGVVDPTPGDNEFTCLNLNITVPQQDLTSGHLLPVMIWIHGFV